jgi:hypothetical protein
VAKPKIVGQIVSLLALMMSKELTEIEQAIVIKASEDLHRYERTCEKHSAVLRRDIEVSRRVQEECAANSLNPMGFMPPRDKFDRYIEEAEAVLQKDCNTALEYAASKFDGVMLICCFL